MDFGDAAPPPPLLAQTQPKMTAPASPDCNLLPFSWSIVDTLGRINYHESEEMIRDTVDDQGPKGVRMATPTEIDAIIANSTAAGGKLTGSQLGVQWVGAEGP